MQGIVQTVYITSQGSYHIVTEEDEGTPPCNLFVGHRCSNLRFVLFPFTRGMRTEQLSAREAVPPDKKKKE